MCPSFSLCAWRILKIRSCLRRPLAPGISRVRAMRLSSVMFFSLSSAMVMFTCGKEGWEWVVREGDLLQEEESGGSRCMHWAQAAPGACPESKGVDFGMRYKT